MYGEEEDETDQEGSAVVLDIDPICVNLTLEEYQNITAKDNSTIPLYENCTFSTTPATTTIRETCYWNL